MGLTELPPSPIPGFNVVEITDAHLQELRRFFETNGEPPGPNEAHEETVAQLS